MDIDNFITPTGEKWDFRLWVIWAVQRGFVYVWPDPPTLGLIGRPVSRKLIEAYSRGEIPEEELLYVHDQNGEGIWIDFLWAPGQWNIVMKFLRATGKEWVGWQHKNTKFAHIRSIKDYSKTRKREVASAPDLLEFFAR